MKKTKPKTDELGRIKGWPPIKKKPLLHSLGLPPNVCSKYGIMYKDTWPMFCAIDGKWLISTGRLDFKRRKLLGFTASSRLPKKFLCT